MKTAANKTKKEIVLDHIKDYATDEQIEMLDKLLSLSMYPNKTDILKLSGYDTNQTYDTAYPIDYYRRIEEIYPNIKDGNFIFDYSRQTFGELVNINNLFTANILKTFKLR